MTAAAAPHAAVRNPAGLEAAPPGARAAAGAEGLRLESALALLHHAGRIAPEGDPLSPHFLQALIDALVDLSSRDALTGIANRRSFELSLAREVDRVARSSEPALLLMVDIDHFKRINDVHGHPAGDQVIRTVAQVLSESVRPMDLVARIGGEEFGLLLPNCPAAFAPQVAARVRERVARTPMRLTDGTVIGVTVSVGGAFAPQWVRSSPGLWLARADLQLYRAKSEGRDRVCLEPSALSEVTSDERELLLGLAAAGAADMAAGADETADGTAPGRAGTASAASGTPAGDAEAAA